MYMYLHTYVCVFIENFLSSPTLIHIIITAEGDDLYIMLRSSSVFNKGQYLGNMQFSRRRRPWHLC